MEQILARIPDGIDLVTTWIRGIHVRKDLRHDKRGDENNIDHIGRGPSGGEELERAIRDHGSTPGHLRGLPETGKTPNWIIGQ